ncbi:MAG: rRNA maturation RNase YbeY [Bacteroidetes bacterium CG18_big_fil_WC_8_21_14_2_50_41_14]|nr:MAG: rRNA maturation RNase YbeY [Bacteroidetes bacterium CG18_big_fil_WC_8_21_14_2_50_41_14]PJB55971.1 MAG: rRNA maturation RNase YbeY [Bacteroidetes bacterium CG_4_9_14_3_um_filter_41_19]
MITFSYLFHLNDFRKYEVYLKLWITQVILLENKKIGDITYIICDDEQLLEINLKFLNHDTYTDIISFPTSNNNNIISGEIFISLPRVIENAKLNNGNPFDEYSRVVIHGILHLIGYNDHTPIEKEEIRAKEDYYLTLRP